MTALSPDTEHPAGVLEQAAAEPAPSVRPAEPSTPEDGPALPEDGPSLPEDGPALPEYDLDRPIALHPLVFLDEGDEVTVGRLDTDSYCVLPADGAALLRELERGVPPQQAADWYQRTYQEQVDIAEFLAALAELDFLAPAGPSTAGHRVPWQRLGRLTFSRPAWLLYGLLLAAATAVMVDHPDLAPQLHHVFFTRYATAVLLLGVFGQFPFVLFHEAFHALAGRRLGLRSRLRIGRRLYMLVAETSLDGLVVVPRRKRYLPILAGMFADLLTIAVLTLIAAALRHPDGGQSLAGGICLALAYLTVLRFCWQLYVFLQTDVYQLIVTVLGCVELHRTACQLVGNRFKRLVGRADRAVDESLWHPRDRAVARWYAWVLVAGYLFSIGTFLIGVLPLVYRLFDTALSRFGRGHRMSADTLADSALFLLVTVAQLVAAAVLMLAERRRRRRSRAVHLID